MAETCGAGVDGVLDGSRRPRKVDVPWAGNEVGVLPPPQREGPRGCAAHPSGGRSGRGRGRGARRGRPHFSHLSQILVIIKSLRFVIL